MIVDITNEVITRVQDKLGDIDVFTSYPNITPNFPCVIIEETSNIGVQDTKDSAGFHHSDVSIQIEIFSNATNKTTVVKSIRNNIDSIMSGELGMNRVYGSPTPNYLDASVYKYTLRYNGKIDKNRKIYRG